MVKKQPLAYQQQDSSCWITSIMNGLVFLLGDVGKIPNEVPRILYAISSRDGTENQQADRIIDFINAYNIGIKCKILQKEAVTLQVLCKIFQKGGVVVSDVQAGSHGVLLTGMIDKRICIFDPNWHTVLSGLKGNITGAEFFENIPDYNAILETKEFFADRCTKKGKLRMGAVSSRYWVQIFRT